MNGNYIDMNMEEMVKKPIVDLLRQITGSVLNNANSCGSAEVQEHAKEVDGAVVMMAAIKLHYQFKQTVSLQTTDDDLFEFDFKATHKKLT